MLCIAFLLLRFLETFANSHGGYTREVLSKNLLSTVSAADFHPNYFGLSLSYWGNLFLTGCARCTVPRRVFLTSLSLI